MPACPWRCSALILWAWRLLGLGWAALGAGGAAQRLAAAGGAAGGGGCRRRTAKPSAEYDRTNAGHRCAVGMGGCRDLVPQHCHGGLPAGAAGAAGGGAGRGRRHRRLVGPAQVAGRSLEFGFLRKMHPLQPTTTKAVRRPIGTRRRRDHHCWHPMRCCRQEGEI